MRPRVVVLVLLHLLLMPLAALAQRDQQVDPTDRGDLVFRGPPLDCASVSGFTSDPCHVGMFTATDTVTEARAGADPNAVHTLTLTSFQSSGNRSAMTSFPGPPSDVFRQALAAYVAAKAARLTYYDTSHLNPKGGYEGGCGPTVASCWDGWDYFNEFDSVGLTEHAYELFVLPNTNGTTPNTDPGGGCPHEADGLTPADQFNSCSTTYAQLFPSIGAVSSDSVKELFWKFFTVRIPSGVTSLSAATTSASDIDLYIGQPGSVPDFDSWSCTSDTFSGNEQCAVSNPAAGGWTIGVFGFDTGTSNFTLTITQAGPPAVRTGAATGITTTAAQLNGTVTANGLSTTTAFDYGPTSSFGQSVAAQTVTGSTPQAVSANIASLACSTLYFFRVRGTSSGGTANSSSSIFRTANCPITFTNDPLVAGVTTIKAIHVNELRAGINAIRAANGIAAFSFVETISAGGTVKASHILELRTALTNTRFGISLPQLAYTNGLFAGVTVKAIDIMEIRDALR